MRILMLNYEFPPLGGGAANANYYLLNEFAERDDINIDLVTSSPDEYEEEQFADNITIYKLDVNKGEVHYWTQPEILRYSWKAYRKSKVLMEDHNYDLIHAWFGVPCGIVARALGLPYLVALRGSDVPGYNERFGLQYVILKPLIRKVWRDAETVVANSQGLRELALETADIPIEVIPNGVAVDEFEPVYHDHDTLQVLCVSRLVERKGIRYLVDAIADLDVELTIVGEGDQEDTLKRQVVDLGIKERVTFAGYVSHEKIYNYYEDADVFVLPSKNEGMSNTVLEAMASGLPVITTETGGTAELIDDNGQVVPMEDSNALTSAIDSYLTTPSLIEQQGRKSRQYAEQMSWKTVADQYRELYQ